MAFIIAHWELFAALAGVATLLVLSYQYEALQGYSGVEPDAAVRLINAGAHVLDLRGRAEFDAGHLPQAVALDAAALAAWAKAPKRKRDRPVVLVTAPGLGAALGVGRAAAVLRKAGFTDIRALRGGMKAWTAAQLPVAR